MHLLRFIPIKLTLFLVLGILIGNYLGLAIYISTAITISLLLLLTFLFFINKNRNNISFGFIVTLCTISIGVLSITLWQPQNWSGHYTHYSPKESNTLKLKIREVLKPSSFSNRYVAIIKEINGERASGKIILNQTVDTTKNDLEVDYELLTYGALEEVKRPLNPYQFDYREYLEGQGIYHELKIKNNAYHLTKTSANSIFGLAALARKKIVHKLQQVDFGKDELDIIQALLLGQRTSISSETYDNYKDAGAVHILAVSGLHIGVLLLLLQFLLGPLDRIRNGKTVKLIVIVVLLWCFAFLAGLSASVVRAVTMFTFVAYALYLNRPSNTFNILALSMFFILLIFNPMLLFQAGFQMSYAAVFSIVWIYPMLQRFWNPKNSIVKKMWQLLAVSLAAQLGVLPISLFYFHQFPGLFFISNVLIVPFLGLILGMGIFVILLALFSLLPDFLVLWYSKMIGSMNSVVEWVANQEAFLFKKISFDGVQLALAYTILVSVFVLLTKASYKRMVVLFITLVTFQSWLLFTSLSNWKKDNLLLLHQTKNSILLHRKGTHLAVHTPNIDKMNRIVTDFEIGERIKTTTYYPLKNQYRFDKKTIIVLDSSGIYLSNEPPDYLLLTQSPRVNLERILDSIQPKQVIADGSNYKSFVNRWRTTCAKRKLPFHYTGEKGVYYFE